MGQPRDVAVCFHGQNGHHWSITVLHVIQARGTSPSLKSPIGHGFPSMASEPKGKRRRAATASNPAAGCEASPTWTLTGILALFDNLRPQFTTVNNLGSRQCSEFYEKRLFHV
jgi:hypothetical protein